MNVDTANNVKIFDENSKNQINIPHIIKNKNITVKITMRKWQNSLLYFGEIYVGESYSSGNHLFICCFMFIWNGLTEEKDNYFEGSGGMLAFQYENFELN